MMKINSLFLSAFLLLLASCSGDISFSQRQPEVPVLKKKDFNNVLEIRLMDRDTASSSTIEEFTISTEGTTDIRDIESIAIWYTGKKESDINENSVIVGESEDIGPLSTVKVSFEIDGPENHFRVSFKLNDDAEILNRVSAVCREISTNRGKITPGSIDTIRPQRIGVAVRKHNEENVHTHRIPGLVTSNSGTLIACYDARRESRRDLQGDIDIGISRSTDGGSTWEPMITALDMGEYGGLPQKFNGVSDAALLVDRNTGRIFVAGLWMHGVLDENGKWIENLRDTSHAWNHQWRNKGSQPGFGIKQTSQFLIASSTDDGRTWSRPVNITGMCKKPEWWLWAPAPGNGITMKNGTLVFPTQGRNKDGEPFSNITFSADGGLSWKTSKPAYTNTTECAVAELDNGSLMLNMRYNRNRNNEGPGNGRVIAVTRDMGNTWKEHPASRNALPEPVCMGSLCRHIYNDNGQERTVLLFSNPDSKKGRHHITIKASDDNGETWPDNYQVMLDEGTGNGYSCLTSVDDDHVGILYESSQADLVFQKIKLRDITPPPFGHLPWKGR